MTLSGELDYRIRYDVEHDLFHAQNVFSDEYITPTFVEYVQKLEKENAELKAELKAIDEAGEHARKQINDAFRNKKPYWELEKENAELKCECRRCVYTDCPCILSDYGKDRNGICDHFKDVFDENTRLKEINTHTLSQLNLDNGELIIQLNKAKVALRKVIDYLGQFCSDYPDCVIEAEKILKEE